MSGSAGRPAQGHKSQGHATTRRLKWGYIGVLTRRRKRSTHGTAMQACQNHTAICVAPMQDACGMYPAQARACMACHPMHCGHCRGSTALLNGTCHCSGMRADPNKSSCCVTASTLPQASGQHTGPSTEYLTPTGNRDVCACCCARPPPRSAETEEMISAKLTSIRAPPTAGAQSCVRNAQSIF